MGGGRFYLDSLFTDLWHAVLFPFYGNYFSFNNFIAAEHSNNYIKPKLKTNTFNKDLTLWWGTFYFSFSPVIRSLTRKGRGADLAPIFSPKFTSTCEWLLRFYSVTRARISVIKRTKLVFPINEKRMSNRLAYAMIYYDLLFKVLQYWIDSAKFTYFFYFHIYLFLWLFYHFSKFTVFCEMLTIFLPISDHCSISILPDT